MFGEAPFGRRMSVECVWASGDAPECASLCGLPCRSLSVCLCLYAGLLIPPQNLASLTTLLSFPLFLPPSLPLSHVLRYPA